MIDRNGDDIVKLCLFCILCLASFRLPSAPITKSSAQLAYILDQSVKTKNSAKKNKKKKKEEINCADPHFAKKILFFGDLSIPLFIISRGKFFFLVKNGNFFKCCRYLSGLVGIRTPPERPKKMLFGFVWICRNWSGLVRICRWRCILHGWR